MTLTALIVEGGEEVATRTCRNVQTLPMVIPRFAMKDIVAMFPCQNFTFLLLLKFSKTN